MTRFCEGLAIDLANSDLAVTMSHIFLAESRVGCRRDSPKLDQNAKNWNHIVAFYVGQSLQQYRLASHDA